MPKVINANFSFRVSNENMPLALAGVAQWIEHRPASQKVAGWIPVRAHAWVAGQVPSRGCVRGNHTLMFLSLSFSLPTPLSKNKQIKSFRKYI